MCPEYNFLSNSGACSPVGVLCQTGSKRSLAHLRPAA